MLSATGKWGNTEQWGDIEQSYLFQVNSLISVYNSNVATCLCFRSITECFCSPLTPPPFPPPVSLHILNGPHNLRLTFLFCLSDNFQTKQFDGLRQSFLITWCPEICRNICLIIDLCMLSKIVTVLAGEFWGKFF